MDFMVFKYNYDEMLDKAYKELPEVSKEEVRFEIPKVKGSIQGNRTIITNLQQIANDLRRDINHVFKFLLRELATTGDIKSGGTIFVGRFNSSFLNEKIEKYVKEFVMCDQCGKPDTELMKERGLTFKRCAACGAKSSVRTLK